MKRLRTAPLALALQLGLLLLLALVMLMPLLWLLSTSLKGPAEDIFSTPPNLWPLQPSLQAYGSLFSQSPMAKYLFNSALVSGFSVIANLLFCSLAALVILFLLVQVPGFLFQTPIVCMPELLHLLRIELLIFRNMIA